MTTPFIPGQVAVGSRVNTEPNIFANLVTLQQIPRAGGLTPTVALFSTNAGTLASVTTVTGYDVAGHFTITAGTASTTGGTQCTVTFGRPLAATPSSINVTMGDSTAGATTNLAPGAVALAKTGFSVVSSALTANHTYIVSYQVWQ